MSGRQGYECQPDGRWSEETKKKAGRFACWLLVAPNSSLLV
ncbi:uncharacterized protein PgNI_03175 [Pyricularia grisea]|uniref:Uncharacterized protein n=1 Tax=Pyricularia grisea TaxID=148305 RepID=A0A6P8B9L1_PYRGI|nr:uncharacterized protein PgNI_03175 [Pyricularia grisea]TLD12509.1 hypothetical protein PgNI_03175 [Pyricularia grisea]